MPLAVRGPSDGASTDHDASMRQRDVQAVCPHCGEQTCRKLGQDDPGLHIYIRACPGCHREFGDEWVEYHHPPAGATLPEAPAGVVAPKPQTPRARSITAWGVLCLLLTFALYGCGDGPSTSSQQPPTQTPTTQEPTPAPTPPPPPPATQLFLGGLPELGAGCGPLPSGARGSLCNGPSSPIPANVTGRHFIFGDSPGEWRGTLAEPLTGTGYQVVLQLAMAPRMTATGVVEILLRQGGGPDIVLFRSAELVVNSDTFMEFTASGEGVAATGAPGDLLVLRITCLRGCQTNGLGVLLVRDRPSFIQVPHTSLR